MLPVVLLQAGCRDTQAKKETPMKEQAVPIVIVDTREKLAYQFAGSVVVRALDVGDYSLEGLEHVFTIERKSLSDLVGSLTHDRDRFERELVRARGLLRLWLLIETSVDDIESHRYLSKTAPNAIIGTLLAWQTRFPALRVLFSGAREASERMCVRILRREWMEYQERNKLNGGSG
jgi:ERCC4-type nuclease